MGGVMPPIIKFMKRGFNVTKTITVIGLGTLGGFLCKHISELDNVKQLIIVDYDVIERRNTYNSIYTLENIGEYKVDALKDKISEEVDVFKINKKYIEGKTSLPSSDLVIDCRDYVYNRYNEIDVRLYISNRLLIIDCRKMVEGQNYPGSYRTILSKNEINKAAFFASQIIGSSQIDELIKNNSLHRIDLDLVPSILDEAIKKSITNKIDIIYDASDGLKQLHCVEENIKPILESNKRDDTMVFLGSSKNEIPGWPKIIEKQSLQSSSDVLLMLSKLIKETGSSANFIAISSGNKVELIEETGGA